jgi:hypothetical protein
MSRTIIGPGAHGFIAQAVQVALVRAGRLSSAGVDGWYGKGTAAAVKAYQRSHALAPTGSIEEQTWRALLPGTPSPSLFERCLALTSTLEGHGFTLAEGNWDGAWLTWGIVGFTLKHGEVQKILKQCDQIDRKLIDDDFGVHAGEIRAVLSASPNHQNEWANSITTSSMKLAEPWKTAFALLGSRAEVQGIQSRLAAGDYYTPALATAKRYRLTTELGVALCFDIHVQNGGISRRAAKLIEIGSTELKIRKNIANAVADSAREKYREDVRTRKLTIATGAGTVHGARYDLLDWGLGEFPAEVTQAKAASAGN